MKNYLNFIKEQLSIKNINLEEFKNEVIDDGNLYGYHVTSKRNLKSIMKIGLETRIPEDYGTDGDKKGVYLFKTLEDTQTALYQWLGERIEDIEEETGIEYNEIILKVNLSGLEKYLSSDVEFEWCCSVNIEASRIIEVYQE